MKIDFEPKFYYRLRKGESQDSCMKRWDEFKGKYKNTNYVWSVELECYIVDETETERTQRQMWLKDFSARYQNLEKIGDWIKINDDLFVHKYSGAMVNDKQIFHERINSIQGT